MTAAPDSSPTPSVLGWRQIAMSARQLAERATVQARRFSEPRLPCFDVAKAKRCMDMAHRFAQIEERIRQWPKRSDAALAGERQWIVNEMRVRAAELERLGNCRSI